MDKAFEANVVSTAPPLPTAIGYPSDGNPSAGALPTIAGAGWFWMITAELLHVLTLGAVTPDATLTTQLGTAIQNMINAGLATVLGWFTGANQSYTPNGFQMLPGGGIRNWTYTAVTIATGEVTVTYAKPFTTFSAVPMPSVVDTNLVGDESNFLGLAVSSYSLTGCVISCGPNGGGSRAVIIATTTDGK